jgi:alpha-mannosidase
VDSTAGRDVAVRVLATGPLRATLETRLRLPIPRAAAKDRQARSAEEVAMEVTLRVSLEAGSRRVDVEVDVDNTARDHRLRLLFPTGAARVASTRSDSAFAAVERPARRAVPPQIRREQPVSAAPMLSFVDAGDDEAGVTVLADGLCEQEIVERADGPAAAVTLLRCVGDLSRDDLATRRGGAGPSLPTPGAQCPGRHSFRLALVPRNAPPAAAALFAAARAFLAPPRAVVATGPASAPREPAPALRVEGEGLVLSALARAQDRESVVVRLFNPGPGQESARLALLSGTRAAFRLDLLERRLDPIPLRDDGVVLAVRPAGIETVELVPEAGR